jgi:hypothetical protein
MNTQTNPKSQNIYMGDYAKSCLQMAARIEKFPNDTHIVTFNGDEYEITPQMVPSFLEFLREQAAGNHGFN